MKWNALLKTKTLDKVFKLPCISRAARIKLEISLQQLLSVYDGQSQVKSSVRIPRSGSISWQELSKHLLSAANTSGSALFLSVHHTEYTNQQQRSKVGIIRLQCHHTTTPKLYQPDLTVGFSILNCGIKCHQYQYRRKIFGGQIDLPTFIIIPSCMWIHRIQPVKFTALYVICHCIGLNIDRP